MSLTRSIHHAAAHGTDNGAIDGDECHARAVTGLAPLALRVAFAQCLPALAAAAKRFLEAGILTPRPDAASASASSAAPASAPVSSSLTAVAGGGIGEKKPSSFGSGAANAARFEREMTRLREWTLRHVGSDE
jgi:hypothetical protein